MSSASKLRVMIVDDEAPARALLEEYFAGIEPCEIVASCADGFEAVRLATETNPDLVVLDVQMPKLDGFDVLELLPGRPAVIFSTAYEEHAIRAFEVAAVDYLLKPFSQERLTEAIERARRRLERHEAPALEEISQQVGRRASSRILVRDGAKIHILSPDRIDYVESQDDYVKIHAGDLELLKKQTLASLGEQLESERFVRLHRCYLVNVDRLDRLEPYSRESRVAILSDGTRIPVSRSGYSRLRELL